MCGVTLSDLDYRTRRRPTTRNPLTRRAARRTTADGRGRGGDTGTAFAPRTSTSFRPSRHHVETPGPPLRRQHDTPSRAPTAMHGGRTRGSAAAPWDGERRRRVVRRSDEPTHEVDDAGKQVGEDVHAGDSPCAWCIVWDCAIAVCSPRSRSVIISSRRVAMPPNPERSRVRANIRSRVRVFWVGGGVPSREEAVRSESPGVRPPAAVCQAGTRSSSRRTERTAARPARLAPIVLADGPYPTRCTRASRTAWVSSTRIPPPGSRSLSGAR